jgi:A/G-specific adenine glycosylase
LIKINNIRRNKIELFKRKLLVWGKSNFANFPWREANKPFYSLIVEILLQRTRAEQVVPVYRQFKKIFSSPRSLSNARLKSIEKLIYPLGLKWRAGKLIKLGSEIDKKHRGTIPLSMDDLLSLSGVGPYAAGAFLSLHCGVRSIIPDANMARILGRVFGFSVHAETRRDKNFLLLCDMVTPKRKFSQFNYAVLDHGRKVCLPKNPACISCPLDNICYYYKDKRKKNESVHRISPRYSITNRGN